MAERPGRRALFTGTSAQKRVEAPVDTDRVQRRTETGPDPGVEHLISTLAGVLNGALSGVRPVPVHPGDLGIAYTPLIDAVNAAVFRLTEAPSVPASVAGDDSGLIREKEAEIEDLQQRIATIIQQHPLPVLLISPELSIIEANGAFCQMSGLLRSQLIGKQVSVIAERERKGEGLATAIRQRLPVEAEITVDLPAGTKNLHQYAVPILDRSGGVEALQVIYTDQTPLKQAEEVHHDLSQEIEQYRHQHQNLIMGLPTPVMIIDGVDAVLDVNPAFCEMSGYSREHLLTVKLTEYPNLAALTAGIALSPDRQRISREVAVEFPTGHHLLREDLVLLVDQSREGFPRGMIILCALEDLSQQREGEQRVTALSGTVHLQKQLIDALIRETPVPLLILDPSGGIVSASDAFVQVSGYAPDRLSGMNIAAFPLLSETGPGIMEIMQQSEGAFGEVKIEFVSGVHDLERYCFPLRDEKGGLTSLLVFFSDKTQTIPQEKTAGMLEETVESGETPLEQSLKDLAAGISRLVGGDYSSHLLVEEEDPLGAIKADYNTAVDRIRTAFEELEEAGRTVTPPEPSSEPEAPSEAEQALAREIESIRLELETRASLVQESSAGVVQGLALLGTEGFIPLEGGGQDPLSEVREAVNSAALRLAPIMATAAAPVPVDEQEGSADVEAAAAAATPIIGVSREDQEIMAVEKGPIDPGEVQEPAPPDEPLQVMEAETMPEPVGEAVPAVEEHDPEPVGISSQSPVQSLEKEEQRSMEQSQEKIQASTSMVDVVAFEMAGQRYALDIQLAREIVEMIPITPIPRSPPYISGIINLRGEITNILNLYTLLGLPEQEVNQNQKIIVLVPDAAEGINVGVIVDNVQSVTQVPVTDIEQIKDDASSDLSGFVKGIIKAKGDDAEGKTTDLIIWIDMLKVLGRLVNQ